MTSCRVASLTAITVSARIMPRRAWKRRTSCCHPVGESNTMVDRSWTVTTKGFGSMTGTALRGMCVRSGFNERAKNGNAI